MFRCLQYVFVENIPFRKKAVAGFNCFYYCFLLFSPARQERKEMGTEQESLAELAVLLPLACGMWKAISEITGLSLVYALLLLWHHIKGIVT